MRKSFLIKNNNIEVMQETGVKGWVGGKRKPCSKNRDKLRWLVGNGVRQCIWVDW